MVFSPEAGYKFEVVVEKACTPENDPIWKLVFDLYKRKRDGFDQIVHVSFRAGTAQESAGVQRMALEGVSDKQADLLTGRCTMPPRPWRVCRRRRRSTKRRSAT